MNRGKHCIVLGMGILVACLINPALGQATQSQSQIKVSVPATDQLSVTNGTQGIALLPNGASGTNALSGDPDATASLTYVHNSAVEKKITAQVNSAGMPAGTQDITLHVTVAGGTEQTIVQEGVAQGAKEVLTGISAGTLEDMQVTYSASATATGSSPGDYTFTVTYTSLDDE